VIYVAIALYAAAMVAANLIVVAFGPWVMPFNGFFLIGLDLALRDWLHVRLRAWQMGLLIASTGLITYLLNPAAQTIAIASAMSFATAALVDWAVFLRMPGTWFQRSASSNVAGALVDSLLFPLIAFGALNVAPALFISKVAGGTVWAWLLSRPMKRSQSQEAA
jgi:hypothetical protein